tara:strand:+ start:352 stop:537 length:186 start_codon:yes stop_codon:yes gene_type:complete
MSKIELLNAEFASLDVEVSSFNGGYDVHSLSDGEFQFSAETLEEVTYWLSDVEATLLNGDV